MELWWWWLLNEGVTEAYFGWSWSWWMSDCITFEGVCIAGPEGAGFAEVVYPYLVGIRLVHYSVLSAVVGRELIWA